MGKEFFDGLGEAITKTAGTPLEDSQKMLCEQIDQRMEKIARYKESLAGVKGRKICPSCGSSVDGSASFCPHCGAACPTRETEAEAGDVVEGTAEEVDVEEQPEEEKQEEDVSQEEEVKEDTNEEAEAAEEEPARKEEAEARETEAASEE